MNIMFDARSVLVGNTRLRLLEAGSGVPLLFLHGSGDLGNWPEVLDTLAEDFHVLRPDHPGFNLSEGDPDITGVSDIAFGYLDLLDQLDIQSCVLAGVSLGGWIAAEMACMEPRRFPTLLLIDPIGLRPRGEFEDYFMLSPTELAAAVYATPAMREEMSDMMTALEDDEEIFKRYLRNRAAMAHLGWNPYNHDPKLASRLRRVTADTTIVWGAEDRLVPVETLDSWREALPGAQAHVIPGAGHLPHIEQTQRFLDAIAHLRTSASATRGAM